MQNEKEERALFLDIAPSVTFWRRFYPLNRSPNCAQILIPTMNCIYNEKDAWSLLESHPAIASCLAPEPNLTILAFDKRFKRKSKTHRVYIWSGPIPERAFHELAPGVFIESPEFMFLHAACLLDFYELIAFGAELCGLYSFDPTQNRGFRQRKVPLTTKDKIARFLDTAIGCKGRHIALRALDYVVDRSASPMETFDEMTMCLPYKYGGYGLPEPSMNVRVDSSQEAFQIAKQGKFFLDMGWVEHSLDVEHHGKYDHSTNEAILRDRARVNALKEMGFEVVELTTEQVSDLVAYEYIVVRIARILGKRINGQFRGAIRERLDLRSKLTAWKKSSGAIR